jgi:hypothetical protein
MPALGTGTGGMKMLDFATLLASELRQHSHIGATNPALLRLVLLRPVDVDAVARMMEEYELSGRLLRPSRRKRRAAKRRLPKSS